MALISFYDIQLQITYVINEPVLEIFKEKVGAGEWMHVFV